MSTNASLIAAILVILVFNRSAASEPASPALAGGKSEPRTFPRIGLKMQVPGWTADIKDQSQQWSLTAYPVRLEAPPLTNTTDRLVISARKLPLADYSSLSRRFGTNEAPRDKSAHPQTVQRSNRFWIVIWRDVYGTNGFVYKCEDRILRLPKGQPEKLRVAEGGEDQELAAEVRRVVNSIEVVYQGATE